MPEISIIVPAFNEEKNISRCLDSILNQTFSDFEIICVDDNSTDKTYDIICEYSEKDSRVKAFKDPGKGVSSARNFGLDNANGNYIAFVDSDDFIQPQMYEYLYKAVKENDCEMSVCGYERVKEFEEKKFEYNCRECTCDEFISFSDTNYVIDNEMKVSSVCMKLIKKDIINSLRFENYALGEDTVFCSNLWVRANKVFFVDLPLYCYFINSESVTHISYHEKKRIDLIKTRLIAYENYLNYKNKNIAHFFLEKGISQINYYRFFSKGTETEKFYKCETKKFHKKYIKDFLKSDFINSKTKMFYLFFYYCPLLYKYYRKHFYGNEK